MVVIILLVVIGVIVFISITIGNFKNRAIEHVLKDTGVSQSAMNSGINSSFEKKHLQNFLQDYPNFTEDSIKELLKEFTVQLFNKKIINEFSQVVCDKMEKDSKLEKMQSMRICKDMYYRIC